MVKVRKSCQNFTQIISSTSRLVFLGQLRAILLQFGSRMISRHTHSRSNGRLERSRLKIVESPRSIRHQERKTMKNVQHHLQLTLSVNAPPIKGPIIDDIPETAPKSPNSRGLSLSKVI